MKEPIELLRLLSSLCDGQLSGSEADRLEELLADPDARRIYLEYMDMQARLVQVGEGERSNPGESGAIPRSWTDRQVSRGGWWGQPSLHAASYAAVVAASIAATVLVQWLLWPSRAPTIHRQTEAAVGASRAFVATVTQMSEVR